MERLTDNGNYCLMVCGDEIAFDKIEAIPVVYGGSTNTNESSVTVSLYFEVSDADIFGGSGTVGYANTNCDFKVSTLAKTSIFDHIENQREVVAKMCETDKEKVVVISRSEYDEATEDDEDEG